MCEVGGFGVAGGEGGVGGGFGEVVQRLGGCAGRVLLVESAFVF